MKHVVAALVILAAACGEPQSAAEAARADSSAAGYAVGPRPNRGTLATATTNGGGASTATTTLAPPPDTTTPAAKASSSAATSASAATPKTADRKIGTDTTARSSGTTSGAASRRDSVPNAGTATTGASGRGADSSAAAAAAGPVRVNEFLTYDERSRIVSLQLVAGYNGLNGSLNYNGATKGNHGIYVPLGWRVHVAVTNHDSDLQHSAIVLEKVLPPPIEPALPAFPGAALPQLDEGLAEDEIGTLDFVASRAGQYMIACGVPGHAQAGMWFQLAVLKGITVPVYR